MNRPVSAIDAIGPAIQRTRSILFRPFDAGKWLILGFLTFLQVLGGGERYGDLRFPIGSWHRGDWSWKPRHSFGWILERSFLGKRPGAGDASGASFIRTDSGEWVEQVLRDGSWWFTHNPAIGIGILFLAVLFALAMLVLFVWLSSRATFCYIDCVAKNRAEVVRPWIQYGRMADSYFFWRLILSILMLGAIAALVIPLALSVVSMANAGETIDPWGLLFGGGIMVTVLPVLVILIMAFAFIRVFMNDFVAPIQYARGIPCGAAFKILAQLVRANPGAFVLYLVMRLLIWLVVYFGLTVLGCATCCVLFCCWIIPVLGQTVLQPFHVFTRAFSLCFLQGFGPGFDVFPPLVPEPAPAGGQAGATASWGGPGWTGESSGDVQGEGDSNM